MKTLLIVITLCCFSLMSIGQTETMKQLLTKDKIWSTGYSLLGNFSNSEYFKVWKDSIVGDKTYSFVVNSTDEFHEHWDTLNYYLFREEEDKVYFENYLYYDFTMQVGDTINFGFDMVVDSIKWQPILNGEIRKHWYLSTPNNPYNQVVWIEGIGSLGGLMDPTGGAYMGGGGTDLLCVYENGEQIYQSPYYDGCYVKLEEDSILPLFTKDKTWSVGYFGEFFPAETSGGWSEYLSVQRDTIIDGKTTWFLKIHKSGEEEGSTISNGTSFTTDGNKVYFENTTLYYDFGMLLGDSIDYGVGNILVLDSIRKLPVFSGELRRYYYLSYFSNHKYRWTETWIEGIGSTNGLLMPLIPADYAGGTETLLCVHENGQQVYQNPEYSSCYVNTVSSPLVEAQQQVINIFSPEKGMIKLQLKTEVKGSLILNSIDGKKLISRKITNSETNFRSPASGILLYRFVSNAGEVQTGKVMIK